MAGYGATPQSPRNNVTGGALVQAIADLSKLGGSAAPPITIGSINRMITLGKAIAVGTTRPTEIEEFERESAAREASV